jgi:hypothetical protein
VAIISMAQHAKPKVIGHKDEARPQFKRLSTVVKTKLSPNLFSSKPICLSTFPGLMQCEASKSPRLGPHVQSVAELEGKWEAP